jgi:hypothetical protein
MSVPVSDCIVVNLMKEGQMNKRWTTLAIFMFGFIFLTGCTTRLTDFTAISTKNVKMPTKHKGSRVAGEDCVVVFIIPFGQPNMKEAIDRAIQKAGSDYDALVDGVLYFTQYPFQWCYKVEGTPINTKESVSMKESDRQNLMLHSKRGGVTPDSLN